MTSRRRTRPPTWRRVPWAEGAACLSFVVDLASAAPPSASVVVLALLLWCAAVLVDQVTWAGGPGTWAAPSVREVERAEPCPRCHA